MRATIIVLFLTFTCVWTSTARESIEIGDVVAAYNNTTPLAGGITIRAFHFDQRPARTPYLVITIYYSSGQSARIHRTSALRAGSYFPENKAYQVMSISMHPETIGNPSTAIAATLPIDAVLRHRRTNTTYRLRDDAGTKIVEKL